MCSGPTLSQRVRGHRSLNVGTLPKKVVGEHLVMEYVHPCTHVSMFLHLVPYKPLKWGFLALYDLLG